MNRKTQSAAELRALCALCDQSMNSRLSQNLLKSLEGHVFLDPQDQVVFESLREILQSGPVTASKLAVHLNNRGFPDIDLSRYFLPPEASPKATERMKH